MAQAAVSRCLSNIVHASNLICYHVSLIGGVEPLTTFIQFCLMFHCMVCPTPECSNFVTAAEVGSAPSSLTSCVCHVLASPRQEKHICTMAYSCSMSAYGKCQAHSRLQEGGGDNESVHLQVNRLIKQATSHENLCQSYIGWCPFW